MNFACQNVGPVSLLARNNDRYLSRFSLESLTGDRAPVFHHQHPPSHHSIYFRSPVDHFRYEQPPPSPSLPSAVAPFCFRQFVGRPAAHFRVPPHHQRPVVSSSSSSPPLSPPSSASSSSTAAGPVDYSPKAAASVETAIVAESMRKPGGGSNSGGGGVSSTSGGTQRRSSAFQDGVTVGYTYDAFFVSDGRSRRRRAHAATSSQPTPSSATSRHAHDQQAPGAAAATTTSRQRYTCAECGKHYATSSNLSRHKQTHRSLDSQQARHCPHCGKVQLSVCTPSNQIKLNQIIYLDKQILKNVDKMSNEKEA